MISLILAIIYIFFSVAILLRDRKNKTNISFSLFLGTISIWLITLWISDQNLGLKLNLFTNRAVIAIGVFSVASLLFFVKHYPKSEGKFTKIETALVLIIIASAILSLVTDWNVKTIELYENGINPILGPLFYITSVIEVAIVFWSVKEMYVKYKKSLARDRYRIIYLFTGFILLVTFVIPFNMIIPAITASSETAKFGVLGTVFFIGFIFIAVWSKNLSDIRIIIGEIILLLISSILTYSIYIILLKFRDYSYSLGNELNFFFTSFIIIVLAVGFIRYSNNFLLKKVASNILKTDSVSISWNEFANKISSEIELNEAMIHFDKFVENGLFVSKYILIADLRKYNRESIFKEKGVKLEEKERKYITEQYIEKGDKKIEDIQSFSNKLGNNLSSEFQIIVPLRNTKDDSKLGVILLGSKPRNIAYTTQDIDVLEKVRFQIENILNRDIIYNVFKSYNLTLNERVTKQTEKIQKQLIDLQEAREKERDMIDIMGHELRTPATIINMNVGLLDRLWRNIQQHVKIDQNKKEEIAKTYSKYLDRINDGIQREMKLINVLLASAKLDGGKIVLNREKLDISKIIETSIHAHEREAKAKNLTIRYINAEDLANIEREISEEDQAKYGEFGLPYVFADKVRLFEIIDNFVSNAVKYTEKGGVTVSVEELKDDLKISVKDTGIGISEKDIKRLGEKFYRAGQYIERNGDSIIEKESSDTVEEKNNKHKKSSPAIVRPGGTGLGLFVAFGLIKEHEGKVSINSTVGLGSEFAFTIKKYRKGMEKDYQTQKSGSKDVFVRMGITKKDSSTYTAKKT